LAKKELTSIMKWKEVIEGCLHKREILCKECSIFHIQHSAGIGIFKTSVYHSANWPNLTPLHKDQPIGRITAEGDKSILYGLHGAKGFQCTACQVKNFWASPSCARCQIVNLEEVEKRRRLMFINGHLIFTSVKCENHTKWVSPDDRMEEDIGFYFGEIPKKGWPWNRAGT
jgi:hypothetical protein